MLRRSAFGFNAFDLQVQPSMRRAFPIDDLAPAALGSGSIGASAFELSLMDRLEAIKRIFDRESQIGQSATVM